LIGKDERSGDGLVRIDPATGQSTRYDRQAAPSPLDDEWIPSFAIAPDGSVFIGTTHNGLLHLRPETRQWRVYTATDGLPSDTIGLVAVESADTVWIGTCNPAGPECGYDDGNYRPLGWINLLARCTIDERE
jgi:ligand-binding sensor domain-containing protein